MGLFLLSIYFAGIVNGILGFLSINEFLGATIATASSRLPKEKEGWKFFIIAEGGIIGEGILPTATIALPTVLTGLPKFAGVWSPNKLEVKLCLPTAGP